MFSIVEKEELAPHVHRVKIEAPLVAHKAQPGQFVILIIDEKGERVPFTLSGWNRDQGTVEFVFLEVGKTTRQLAQMKVGDTLSHFVGPLGRPTHIDNFGHVVCVVSGYGIAAITPVIEALKEKGNQVTTILQSPDPERLFGEEKLRKISDELVLALGGNGGIPNPTSLKPISQLVENHPEQPIHRVLAMSSFCLMRLCCEITRPKKIPTFVHLAPLMVDGTGMCGACRCVIEGKNRFACVDGPEFDGHLVEGWDVLTARRCSYADELIGQQSFQCASCSQW
jgi:ferredoxin--NADP+ reductase